MVEGSGFENRRTGNGSVSSNLTSSAEIIEEAAVRVGHGGQSASCEHDTRQGPTLAS